MQPSLLFFFLKFDLNCFPTRALKNGLQKNSRDNPSGVLSLYFFNTFTLKSLTRFFLKKYLLLCDLQKEHMLIL